ncbi:MAG: rod shape-determining protein RodA [Actinobacteria bacterium]|nr:rod shape-determining protein RodA [Actinomycetota bacterium]
MVEFKKDLRIQEKKEKKLRIKFDFILLSSVILISLFGILMIYSATRFSLPGEVDDPQYYMKRQALFFGIGLALLLLTQLIDYRKLKKYWLLIFGVNIVFLISVLLFGYEVHGSKSWLDLKFTSVQPSEFSKIFMVISVAAVLSRWRGEKESKTGFKKVFFSLLISFITIILIMLEPDYGTSLIFFLTYIGMLFISGANFLYFLGILILTLGGLVFGFKIGLIKQYHLDRLLVLIKPEVEKEGIGYNLFQSKLAIGSGELWGKGLFLGKQTNLNYVPEHHTDFIFSVIGEELGFFGALLAIILLTIIIWRCFYVSSVASDRFGSLVSGGVGFIILSQVFINIGMTIGIMPIIGVPLPFLSYGGSNLISVFLGIGIVENVYARREMRRDYEIAYQEFY